MSVHAEDWQAISACSVHVFSVWLHLGIQYWHMSTLSRVFKSARGCARLSVWLWPRECNLRVDGGVREPLGSALVPTADRLGKETEERADMCACACKGKTMVWGFQGEKDNGGEDLAARASGIECIKESMCVLVCGEGIEGNWPIKGRQTHPERELDSPPSAFCVI